MSSRRPGSIRRVGSSATLTRGLDGTDRQHQRTAAVAGTQAAGGGGRARLPREDHRRRVSPSWPSPGLDRTTLEPILTYCAERRCEADDATCPGCRLRMEKLGIRTFDDFVARHAEIAFDGLAGASARLRHGNAARRRAWSSWPRPGPARSIGSGRGACIRKLRHGIRRAGRTGKPPAGVGEAPVLILVRPQLADNIGMIARAMANFGLGELRLVAPRDGWPNEKARIAASGANFIVDGAAGLRHAQGGAGRPATGCAPPPPASAISPRPC